MKKKLFFQCAAMLSGFGFALMMVAGINILVTGSHHLAIEFILSILIGAVATMAATLVNEKIIGNVIGANIGVVVMLLIWIQIINIEPQLIFIAGLFFSFWGAWIADSYLLKLKQKEKEKVGNNNDE